MNNDRHRAITFKQKRGVIHSTYEGDFAREPGCFWKKPDSNASTAVKDVINWKCSGVYTRSGTLRTDSRYVECNLNEPSAT